MGARAKGDVIIDAHGKGIGLLEHHAHALAQQRWLNIFIDIRAVQQNFAVDSAAFHQIVHTVDGFEQRALAAAAGADEGSDFLFMNSKVYILQSMKAAVMQIQIRDFNFAHVWLLPILLAMKDERPLMPRTTTSSTTAVA